MSEVFGRVKLTGLTESEAVASVETLGLQFARYLKQSRGEYVRPCVANGESVVADKDGKDGIVVLNYSVPEGGTLPREARDYLRVQLEQKGLTVEVEEPVGRESSFRITSYVFLVFQSSQQPQSYPRLSLSFHMTSRTSILRGLRRFSRIPFRTLRQPSLF